MKQFKLSKNKLFLTADTHFFHEGIIRYCNRPFESVQEMNDELVRLWNEKVPKDATVIHMGDFAFGRCTPNDVAGIVKSLNGKIIFIEGNHDHATVMKAHYKWNIFTEVHKELDIRVITDEEHPGDYIDIHCSHFPKLVWNRKHYGAWHAFGHCHSTRPIRHQDFNQHDCGVDGNGYAPISIKEFGSIITTRHLVGWEK